MSITYERKRPGFYVLKKPVFFGFFWHYPTNEFRAKKLSTYFKCLRNLTACRHLRIFDVYQSKSFLIDLIRPKQRASGAYLEMF